MPTGHDDARRVPVEHCERNAEVELPTASEYDARYFARVYGGSSTGEGAAQRLLDRLRDARISDVARRYAPAGPGRPAVLDVGCGYGWILDRLGDSFDLYAMDVSSHALARTGGRVSDAVVAHANV